MSLPGKVRALETCVAMLKFWQSSQTLLVTKRPLYETRDIWAEESGGAESNSAEWSFGNGATGFMGLPIDAGWEVVALAYHADTYPSTAQISVALCDYTTPSNAASNIIATISLDNAQDGGGDTNNACKFVTLPAPIVLSDKAILGFRTITEVGSVSDHRVYARLRRQIGEYVADVTLS